MKSEIETKMERLESFLDRHHLDGVFLNHRANFAWITGGRDNYIAGNSPNGVAAILATRDKRICFTNTIEAPRFSTEELAGTDIEVVAYTWHNWREGQRMLKEIIRTRKFASDVADNGDHNRFDVGMAKLPDEFSQLRWSLTPQEIERYREGGRRTSAAMEAACRRLSPGMTEFEIAGVLDTEVWSRGLVPVVTLIAGDERIARYRHPIAKEQRVSNYCMLVTCASFGGLISNMTRFVSFKALTPEIRRKQQAVCNVDTAVNLSTKPGKTFGEMFAVLEKAYAESGFAGEQNSHHQGGSTGYAGRDVFTEPGSEVRVLENQAFAWNPSITGVKSEDTILCTASGVEVLTGMSMNWPKVTGRFGGETMERADILVK
jgi:Xaa-Pro dipeptidase